MTAKRAQNPNNSNNSNNNNNNNNNSSQDQPNEEWIPLYDDFILVFKEYGGDVEKYSNGLPDDILTQQFNTTSKNTTSDSSSEEQGRHPHQYYSFYSGIFLIINFAFFCIYRIPLVQLQFGSAISGPLYLPSVSDIRLSSYQTNPSQPNSIFYIGTFISPTKYNEKEVEMLIQLMSKMLLDPTVSTSGKMQIPFPMFINPAFHSQLTNSPKSIYEQLPT